MRLKRLKRLAVLLGVFLCMGIFSSEAAASGETYHVTTLDLSENNRVLIKTSHPIEALRVKKKSYPLAEETVYSYNIKRFNYKAGTLEIVKREFANGDFFLFTKVDNNKRFHFYMELDWSFSPDAELELKEFSQFPKPAGESAAMGEDRTSYPTGLLDIQQAGQTIKQIMIGKSYQSIEHIKRYEYANKSVIRELKAEADAVTKTETEEGKNVAISLQSTGKDIVEQWLMFSDSKLFESEKELLSWMKYSSLNYRKTNKWYTSDGPYNKMVLTVEPQPRSKMGYGRTLLNFREAEAFDRWNKTNERYYYNLVSNSVADLLNFRGEKTFWETEVTSTYLLDLYNMTAPFIDTRFNEYIALYLRDVGEALAVSHLREPLLSYADFLLSQIETGNVIPVNEQGALIPDYFAVYDPVLTHTSLNHGLGGLNILLEAYLSTSDEKYLRGAEIVQEGISGLDTQWLREDGDTWYKVNPDLTFIGRDYELLTLEDLLKTYGLWSKINQENLPIIETFLESKSSYLKNNGIKIPSHTQELLYSYGIGN
ncbi:hypothetical protein [Cytobacillus sp. NCCP-133]|uniref:hypothetical protein n=1 Tax=Cytobacillus sp. NCCP-133 TaxID=766848 RepID=UPI00222F5F32|nr:hypothetical protein [Cytobacillus sp. NCCP-133]GLB60228.1 hypothetical protein NCCP133_23600 [Cytobacillus sp. NCCP-133]